MYKKYTDGKRTIHATEKAFEVIYKNQGFKEVEDADEEITEENTEIDEEIQVGEGLKELESVINFDDMKVEELKEIAKEKGVEGYSKMKKEELISALVGE